MHRFSAAPAVYNDQVLWCRPGSLQFRRLSVARNQRDCDTVTALRQMAGLSVASKPGQDEAVSV
jgi:hypothetical protein